MTPPDTGYSLIQAGFVQLFVISWQYQHVLKHEMKQAVKAEPQKGHKLLYATWILSSMCVLSSHNIRFKNIVKCREQAEKQTYNYS